MAIRRLRYWIKSARRSEALREEMELHLAETAAELQAGGMTAERARAEARRRFGNVGLKQEESREIWMTRFWSELGQDVRYGCRTMTANKAFSALDGAGQRAFEHDLMVLIGRFNRSKDATMVVPSEYLEIVVTRG